METNTHERLLDLRKKVMRGEELTVEEMREVVTLRQQGRQQAAALAAAKPKRTKERSITNVDIDALLGESI